MVTDKVEPFSVKGRHDLCSNGRRCSGADVCLVDVFWDTRAEQLSFPSAQEQELLEKAQGAVLVVHLARDDPDPRHWKKLLASVRNRMGREAGFVCNFTFRQRADTPLGLYRQIDLLCTS